MDVADLPRRTAHAVFALVAASRDLNSPVTAAEAMLYDAEALSPRGTGMALRHARRLELATYDGRYWWPTNAAYDLYTALEDRFLADTDAP